MTPIDKLRRVVRWADNQDEDRWNPPPGNVVPSIEAIIGLYDLCIREGVDNPNHLSCTAFELWDLRWRQ